MPDFVYDIRDKILDLADSVRDMVPVGAEDYIPYALPGLAAVLSALAILFSVQSNSTAGKMEEVSRSFNTGTSQLESVLHEEEPINVSADAVENIGRSDLLLQYKRLSELGSEAGFNQMEKMAQVSSSAEDAAQFDRDQVFYESIPGFAGDYGGVAVKRGVEGTEADIRMAAYLDEGDMSAPEDSTVMNVLVQHLSRVIPATQYGQKDTRNTLVILSGTDIRKFSVIQKGAVMYTLFGKSEGTKINRKYICTGIEPGTIDEMDQEGNSFLTDGTDYNSVLGAEMPIDGNTNTSAAGEEAASEDGFFAQTGRAFPRTDASIRNIEDEGRIVYTDGTVVYPTGVVVYSDGTIVDSDGTVYYPDGMIVHPDGTISGGKITGQAGASEEDETSENENPEDEEDPENPENPEEENPEDPKNIYGYDVGNGVDGTEFEGMADSVFTRHVYAADGSDITSNKKNDLIFYMINSQTGTVTITYWDLAGNPNAEAVLAAEEI